MVFLSCAMLRSITSLKKVEFTMLARLLSPYPQLVDEKSFRAWSEIFLAHMRTLDHEFDMGHRIDHVLRVTKTAVELAALEGASLPIVLPAAMLHDTQPVSKFGKDRSRASQLSADHTLKLLAEWAYPEKYFEAIHHAIVAHSFSANVTPTTVEARVVQDADRLDALGAIGIARTMACGFKNDNPLYNFDELFPRIRKADDTQQVVDHFYIKLFRLPESFTTQSAKIEGAKRIATMEMYLQGLADEVGEEYLSFAEYCRLAEPAYN